MWLKLWHLGYSQSFAYRMWAGATRSVLRFPSNPHNDLPLTAKLSGFQAVYKPQVCMGCPAWIMFVETSLEGIHNTFQVVCTLLQFHRHWEEFGHAL